MIGLDGKVLDMYDLSGGRASEVESLAGYRVDVFRLWRRIGNHSAVTARAAAIMAEDVATAKYSLFHAILAGSRLCSRRFRKECNRHGLHCSQAVSKAYREAGVDLCPAVIDLTTLPDHLALSPFLVGVGRLEI